MGRVGVLTRKRGLSHDAGSVFTSVALTARRRERETGKEGGVRDTRQRER